jgi:hypothetical protein
LRQERFQDETEWQHYLRACIEIVIKVSDLLPDDILQIVVSSNPPSGAYMPFIVKLGFARCD